MIKDVSYKVPFVSHGRRKLTADAFNGSPKEATIVKLLFGKPMRSKFMSLDFKHFSVLLNLFTKGNILFTLDYIHAATWAF